MLVSLIVAMADNRVIGLDGKLPWHIPAELKLFKETTLGKPIIMGRKTWESLGRPLPGRDNIVITRNPGYRAEGAKVAGDLDSALRLAGGCDEAMIIGGAEIYNLALDRVDRMYLTEVHLMPEGDAQFPYFDPGSWRQTRSRDFPGDGEIPAYSVTVLDRA
ncbi:MAG: dihydrofolate reductase [Rhodospirillaceae bacterium]|nr:dihydrofolate reductase [Rhodospirillaceae bacterium]